MKIFFIYFFIFNFVTFARNNHKYDTIIVYYSNKYGVCFNFVKAVISAESGFQSNAVSPKGAIGLMQLMPNTAKIYNTKVTKNSLFDPNINISIGVRHLADLLYLTNNVEDALLAYNAGSGSLKWNKKPKESLIYIKNVKERYFLFKNNNYKFTTTIENNPKKDIFQDLINLINQ